MNSNVAVTTCKLQCVTQEVQQDLEIAPLITIDLTRSPVIFVKALRSLDD